VPLKDEVVLYHETSYVQDYIVNVLYFRSTGIA
jgi:hypothetical protein